MTIELARARLRGIYAIVAGAIILLVIPFFESTILAGTGYLTAVADISNHQDFGPYLTWVGQNQETDVIFHIVQFIAFLLAFTLPATLRVILWPGNSRGARSSLIARFSGQIGFACYALAVVFGLLVSGNSGGSYVNAAPSERASVANSFGTLFAIQNMLAHMAGGVLVAIALMFFSARMMREGQKSLPGWLGYLGVLVAALLVVTALQFAGEPAAAETSISSISFLVLAVWLICVGAYLARLRSLPGPAAPSALSTRATPSTADTASNGETESDNQQPQVVGEATLDTGASASVTQTDGQSAPE